MTETLDLTRYIWHRPPDDPGADAETVGKVRDALKRLDQKLDIWWNSPWRPERWTCVYWMARAQRWDPVFFWEAAGGGPKSLTVECIDHILRELSEHDTARAGKDIYTLDQAAERWREMRQRKDHEEFQYMRRRHAMDYGRRLQGKLITVGPGGPRSRSGLGDDPEYEQFLRETGRR